jgi:hypothetical protein
VNKIAKINKVKLDDVLPLLESENEMTSLTKSEEAPKEDSKQKRDNLFTVVGLEFTTLVVIGTDCTCSCKSNHHTITTTVVMIIKYNSH